MGLWLTLTTIFAVVMIISLIRGRVCGEKVDDDRTWTGFLFSVGCVGTVLSAMISVLCI